MAARISGINLPDNKRIVISLSYVKGIGKSRSQKILASAGIDESKRAKDLSEEEINKIRNVIDKEAYLLEGELARQIHSNIKRLKEIGSWRGLRHSRNLPVNGQRTKTNSRTVRGNVRKTAASGKKLATQKT